MPIDNVVEDTTPQLGGDLDLNGNNIDFPSTANISDCKDEDDMASDDANALATQQSIKAYIDTHTLKWEVNLSACRRHAGTTNHQINNNGIHIDGGSWTHFELPLHRPWSSNLRLKEIKIYYDTDASGAYITATSTRKWDSSATTHLIVCDDATNYGSGDTIPGVITLNSSYGGWSTIYATLDAEADRHYLIVMAVSGNVWVEKVQYEYELT